MSSHRKPIIPKLNLEKKNHDFHKKPPTNKSPTDRDELHVSSFRMYKYNHEDWIHFVHELRGLSGIFLTLMK